MKLQNKLQAVMLLAGVIGLATISTPANAQSQDTTPVNLTINAGALTITGPGTPLALSAITCSTTLQNSTGTTGTITITDTTGSLAGWTSTFQFTNLAGVTDNTKIVRLASESPIDVNTDEYLTVTPSTITPGVNSNTNITSYNTAQQITELSALTSAGLSDAFDFASATAGNGAGTYTGTISASLGIPPYCRYPDDGAITAQNYTGTLFMYVV